MNKFKRLNVWVKTIIITICTTVVVMMLSHIIAKLCSNLNATTADEKVLLIMNVTLVYVTNYLAALLCVIIVSGCLILLLIDKIKKHIKTKQRGES